MSTTEVKEILKSRAFGCDVIRLEHTVATLQNLPAKVTVILPPRGETLAGCLIWLCGLTGTDDLFSIKAGGARLCAQYNVAVICPDTSPRGAGAPDEEEDWDFGTAASFYVNATTKGFEAYQMETYLVEDLLTLVKGRFSDRVNFEKMSIFGHSMGGLGALKTAMRHRDLFTSVSAFAPISHPTECPWGVKGFTGYLGEDRSTWEEHDPTLLIKKKGALYDNILVDQGMDDKFLEVQLKPEEFAEACKSVGQKLELNMVEGYDHSYFFVQTFMEKHMAFHADKLGVCSK